MVVAASEVDGIFPEFIGQVQTLRFYDEAL
jgi:hypothetical protein